MANNKFKLHYPCMTNLIDLIWIDLWPIFLFSSCEKIYLGNFVSIKQNAGDYGWFKQNTGETCWKFSMWVKVQNAKCGWLGIYVNLPMTTKICRISLLRTFFISLDKSVLLHRRCCLMSKFPEILILLCRKIFSVFYPIFHETFSNSCGFALI